MNRNHSFILVLFALFLLAGCGGSANSTPITSTPTPTPGGSTPTPAPTPSTPTPPSSTAALVYVANADSHNISGYRIDSTGAVAAVPGSPFASAASSALANAGG